MCCCRKKKKPQKCTDTTTTTMPRNTAQTATNTNTANTAAGGKMKVQLANRPGSMGKSSKPKVFDVHKKILSMEEKHQKVSEKQMEEAMQILGCSTINTTIIKRLEKASKEKCEKKSQVSTPRQGDIQFTLAKPNIRKQKKDDDTIYPLHQSSNNASNNENTKENNSKDQAQEEEEDNIETELLKEDWKEEPNSENYMWNAREIRYTCCDMFKHLDKNVIIEATGDPCGDEENETKIEWDPYAPLNILESRPVFDCHTLRKNTFLSTALCCSTTAEQKAAKAKPKITVPKKVKVIEPSRELPRLRGVECTAQTTNYTANTDSTIRTQETVDRSNSNKK